MKHPYIGSISGQPVDTVVPIAEDAAVAMVPPNRTW